MSMVIYVLFAKDRMPSVKMWQAAIDALGFGVKLNPAWCETASGFSPAKFEGRDSGFEIYVSPALDIVASYPQFENKFDGLDCAATFRWGGDLVEAACAMVASTSLAKLSHGVWIDPQEGAWLETDVALEQARSVVSAVSAGPSGPFVRRSWFRRLLGG
jgi:hypothetical protein